MEAVIRQAFAEEFGFKMDDAILDGSGEGEPLGILNCGALIKVEKEKDQKAIINKCKGVGIGWGTAQSSGK